MPELFDLLDEAAKAMPSRPAPPFQAVLRRAGQRRQRRVLGVAVLAVALAASASLLRPRQADHVELADPVDRPCVTRDAVNARDHLLAIPRQGVREVTLAVGDILTIGWLTCGETGDVSLAPDDPKLSLLADPDGGRPVDTAGVASVRLRAYRTGSVRVTGASSLGSTGTLAITITEPVEPIGASQPSPFPLPYSSGPEDICQAEDAVDADGRLTRPVSFAGGGAVLSPPGDITSRFSAEQTLQRNRSAAGGTADQVPARAVFGLLTDPNSSPFPQDLPAWVVVTCDGAYPRLGHSLPYGPVTPAPGTPPTPGGAFLQEGIVPYDETGQALYGSSSSYPDAALRAELLIEVPFTVEPPLGTDQRQVLVSYRTDDTCASFDHLDVQDPDPEGEVRVQVWLHLRPGSQECTGTQNTHQATVGLRYPLAGRQLVRGSAAR